MTGTARAASEDDTATSTPISDQLARGLPSDAAQTSELSESNEAEWVAVVAEELVSLRNCCPRVYGIFI